MPYNKNYDRGSGRGRKENRKPRLNILLAFWVLVLLGILYAIIFHGSEIRNIIAGNSSDKENENQAIDNGYTEKIKEEWDILFEEEKDEVEQVKENVRAIDTTEIAEPETKIPIEKPAKQTVPNRDEPATAKSDNYSKHKLERFVGQDNGKYGVEDLTTKKTLIPATYDRIKEVRQGLKNPYFIVCKDQLWGVVNAKNEVVIPIENTNINEYVHKRDEIYLELSKENADGKSIDGYARMPEGKIVVPFKYGYVTRLTNDYKYFEVREDINDRKSGIVDQNDRLILPMEYATVRTTIKTEGYAIISKFLPEPEDGRTYYLTGLARLSDGKIVIPVEYQEFEIIGPVSFIRVKKNGLYGCINDKNEVIVPFQKVTSVGATIGMSDDSNNKVHFTLPNGESVAYDAKGKRVPTD